jgi:methyl-accepting chemotaxis protein
MSGSSIESQIKFNLISPDDVTILKENSEFLLTAMDPIIEHFYRHIQDDPETAKLFSSEFARRHAKDMQIRHWRIILGGEFDGDYEDSTRKVGETHRRLGLGPRWYMGAYSYTISKLCEAIALRKTSHWRGASRAPRLAQLQGALVRTAMLDMEFALSAYLEAERRDRAQGLEKVAAELEMSVAVIVKSVSATAGELQMGADFMTSASVDVVAEAAAVADASALTSSNMNAVSAATTELTQTIAEISEQVRSSREIANACSQIMELSDTQIESLSHAAEEIGGIVGIINAIATQTNMLALNATIEAARAGESGRGFAVVALEVKALAEQTRKATAEIGAKITAIGTATKTVAANITQIAGMTGQASKAAGEIATAVAEESESTREIARNVTEATNSVASVAKRAQAVSAAAGKSTTAATEVLACSKKLTRESGDLKLTMDKFLRSIMETSPAELAPPAPPPPAIELFG